MMLRLGGVNAEAVFFPVHAGPCERQHFGWAAQSAVATRRDDDPEEAGAGLAALIVIATLVLLPQTWAAGRAARANRL